FEPGGRYATTTILRYTISIVGVVIAFAAIGVTWQKVQWIAAAITVGLGFGLQEIFGNFMSGLIILFERPIRVGDTVTVGDISGTVTRIRIRATTVTDWDRKELIIPNKEFVTTRINNWSLSDPILRIILPVGVAYGSDTQKATQLLLDVARACQHVLDDPPPRALFLGFGDSSLNLELRVFIPSIDSFLTTRHELHEAIDKAFREAGIEIAFPQRDIHVRSVRSDFPVRIEPGSPRDG
ncbi:MAG: mechanosensitive ion channel domain-containing protein, partial [Planctomycetota bacterium]